MKMQSDDGSLLEVQEGVLFDKDGGVILDSTQKDQMKSNRPKLGFRMIQFKGSWPTLFFLVPLAIAIGMLTLALGAVSLLILFIRSLFFKRRSI